jgi:hypothetical protein
MSLMGTKNGREQHTAEPKATGRDRRDFAGVGRLNAIAEFAAGGLR